MRYNNWDVLIFPETGESKTPLQEFGTVCMVTEDPDIPSAPSTAHPAYLTTVTRPLPTVSCYIPSLPNDTPFRVSLHSWATPQPSRATLSMSSPENVILYEARVWVDGICVAGIWFNQDPSWPQVIDMSSRKLFFRENIPSTDPDIDVDKANNLGQLRFPPFHSEMLTQVWADATQNLGRVKIIIAEGIRNGQGNYGFQRLKNVVMFSFQHAPLHILENCGIAWPNAGMWLQAQQQFYNVSSMYPDPADAEAHGHSPRCRDASTALARLEAKMVSPGNGTAGQPAFQDCGVNSNDPFWSQHGPVSDPFTGGVSFNSFYKNMASCNTTGPAGDVTMKSRSASSSHEVPTPDASRPLPPTSSRRSHPMPDYSEPPSLAASRKGSKYANPGTDGLERMAGVNLLLSSKGQDEFGA
ncbi:hypothetical protein ABVK25_009461 [Lepraria finkii]|uniref:Uncharacterized protein n=1 Tax=Lepraria finkii TaxID=1340010 RepID=A0ABR4AX35_9LECA